MRKSLKKDLKHKVWGKNLEIEKGNVLRACLNCSIEMWRFPVGGNQHER